MPAGLSIMHFHICLEGLTSLVNGNQAAQSRPASHIKASASRAGIDIDLISNHINLKCQHATEDVDAICHSYCTMYCHQRLCALEIHAEKVIRGFPPLYHWRKQLEDVGTHISHVLLWVIVFSYRASMSPEQPWSHLAEIKCQLSFGIASLRQKLNHKL